jgi:copper homeostasis protein
MQEDLSFRRDHSEVYRTQMPKILLEVCCGSLDDAIQAELGEADRIELCSALFLGGLTPSAGTIIEARRRLRIPFLAMVRPRAGGFCYSAPEMDVMVRDTENAIELGADGVVFGILKENGTIDIERSRQIRERIGNHQAVFHRAFDVTPDPFRALEELIDLGITRVLTSGQQNAAPDGAELIRQLIERANGRIEILPGGGLRVHSLEEFVAKTGCVQVHLAAPAVQYDNSTLARPWVTFGAALYPSEIRYEVTDRRIVETVVKQLGSASDD